MSKSRYRSESSEDNVEVINRKRKSVIGMKIEKEKENVESDKISRLNTRKEARDDKADKGLSRRSRSHSLEEYRRKRDYFERPREKYRRSRSYERSRRKEESRHDNKRKRSVSPEMPKNRERDTKEKRDAARNEDGDKIDDYWAAKRTKKNDNLLTKTGGAYIPPAKLRMLQAKMTDKSGPQFQRIAWEALKKSIHGLINKVTASNVVDISRELFQENVVRGRGLLVKSLVQAQSTSLTFTHVYAALVAVVNSKFPQVGELLLKRLILQFKRGFKRNIKTLCLASTKFLAHLFNQKVIHEIIILEILILLLEKPTNDSVEVAVGFLKECGQKLSVDSPTGTLSVFDSLRSILNESKIEMRVMYMIEVIFAIRKDGYKDYPSVTEELDLVEEDDQFTHTMTLEDEITSEDHLNAFKVDTEYDENEEKYLSIKKELLGEGSDNDGDDEDDSDGEESGEESGQEGEKTVITDNTETNLVTLRRTIYLTIQSSLDYEECCHKLLKMQLKPGQTPEICYMILDCAAQQRTYEKFFGLLAQRFCMLDKKYVEPYENIFKEQYDTIHRLETNKLRNVAKFFAHLLFTDAISWEVLQCIKLNEDDTTSSSRIFIKILFQELSEYMGLRKLNDRLKDPTLQTAFEGIFPKDNPRNTRFSINFFTSIGLGGLTDEFRNYLKAATAVNQKATAKVKKTSSSSSSSSSDEE